jgi:hypothetical protein
MMGGQESTDGVLRLFLMPGMWHVWGYVSSTPLLYPLIIGLFD